MGKTNMILYRYTSFMRHSAAQFICPLKFSKKIKIKRMRRITCGPGDLIVDQINEYVHLLKSLILF